MSTSDPATGPTLADLQAIAQRVEAAAKTATDAATAATAGRAAADDESKARGLNLPAEVLDQIAKASSALTVAALREEFEVGAPTDPTSASAGAAASATGTADTADPAPGSAGDPAPVVPKNFAQRFLGL
jgi:hypothetical protein